jgi:hypothetical protein
MHYLNFFGMNVGQNFECCWKYSIFCRNSLILKAHEKSDEIQTKIEISIFHGVMKGCITKTSLGRMLGKVLIVVGNIQFFVEILEF